MRRRITLVNIFYSVLLEVFSILSGFVIPSCIIKTYGSGINGLTNSMASFMGYISILQLGAGSVIKAVLYKPLAEKDNKSLSVIAKTSNLFFGRIGVAGIFYMFVLALLFPLVIRPEYDFWFSASLVLIIGIGTVVQYLFGITYQMILEADQKTYVYAIAQIVTIVLNTISTISLTRVGCSIQIVKLFSASFFVLRPVILSIYVKKRYSIDRYAKPNSSVIAQRWDGFAHGLAYFVHSRTDVFVLTILSSMENVSVYGVYSVITTGITAFVSRIDVAVRARFGNIFAKGQIDTLKTTFYSYLSLIHIMSSTCFSTAVVTVNSFIKLYVGNVNDADYIQPLFATVIITAEMFYCLRMPYNSVIFVSNKFRDTKIPAFLEAIINIIISCILVPYYGLIGVAVGTLIAMIYRTISFVIFLHSNILNVSYSEQFKRYLITLLGYSTSILLLGRINMATSNYLLWGLYAFFVFSFSGAINVIMNILFDRNNFIRAFRMLVAK